MSRTTRTLYAEICKNKKSKNMYSLVLANKKMLKNKRSSKKTLVVLNILKAKFFLIYFKIQVKENFRAQFVDFFIYPEILRAGLENSVGKFNIFYINGASYDYSS